LILSPFEEPKLNTNANFYKFHPGYWVLVLIVALMASRSVIEFGRSSRLLQKPRWQQHLMEVCADNKNVCKSLAFIDSGTWWTSHMLVEVIPRKSTLDQGAEAYRLVDAALTNEQREFMQVYLRQEAAETKSTGGHS
jgi:hypothetical protein